jgi:7,8-dihydropterin-6-yl-methyl-4-(beta-D-ribofuranosyl)aminobenzene 5'-phosphate synthase
MGVFFSKGVTITTVVDNYLDVFETSTPVVERIVPGRLKKPLLAGHGLAFLVEVDLGEKRFAVLMDTGNAFDFLRHNMEALGRAPNEADAVFLSHGHPDHYGGLLGFLAWRGAPLPVYTHPDAFWPKYLATPRGKVGPWQLERARLEEAGAELHCSREVQELQSGVYLSGEIPRRTDFEGGMPGARIIKDGNDLVDPLLDEQALVVNLGEKGIVVISGCSHPGIVNTIHHAREITGNDRLLAVIGGFHLAQVSDEVMARTVAALKESKARLVVPGHCTGFRPNARLSSELGDVFAINCVGTRIVLSGQ